MSRKRAANPVLCSVPGCLNKHYAKGCCKKHYCLAWQRNRAALRNQPPETVQHNPKSLDSTQLPQ